MDAVVSHGQHTITDAAGLPGNYNGMTFDAGFSATHWFVLNGGGGPFGWYVDGGLMSGAGGYIGGNNGQNGGALSGGSGQFGTLCAINNSNVLGVTGASAAGALTAN